MIERRGSLMMTFMPAIGERKYDWEKKQVLIFCSLFPPLYLHLCSFSSDNFILFVVLLQKFALSPTEVGSLISMGSKDSSEFFHDPSMKSKFVFLFNT